MQPVLSARLARASSSAQSGSKVRHWWKESHACLRPNSTMPSFPQRSVSRNHARLISAACAAKVDLPLPDGPRMK